MSTDLTEFLYGDKPIRTVEQDGETWFVAKDVCAALGIGDASKAVERLDADEVRTNSIRTTAGERDFLTVSLSGLYALIFTSRKPDAQVFRRWVTGEVLPALRKHGRYETARAAPVSDNKIRWAKMALVRAAMQLETLGVDIEKIDMRKVAVFGRRLNELDRAI
jgi:prophage antirepressor-like protein